MHSRRYNLHTDDNAGFSHCMSALDRTCRLTCLPCNGLETWQQTMLLQAENLLLGPCNVGHVITFTCNPLRWLTRDGSIDQQYQI